MSFIQEFEEYKKKGWALYKENGFYVLSNKNGLKYPLLGEPNEWTECYTEFEYNSKKGIEEIIIFLGKCSKKTLLKLVKEYPENKKYK